MKITVLSAQPVATKFNNVLSKRPVLNDKSDVVIVNSDDYFDDKLFEELKRLKKKYLALFVIGFNQPDLMAYNKQYVEFCFDHNINFLDYDQDTSNLNDYLEQNIVFDPDYTMFAKYYLKLQPVIDYSHWFGNTDFSSKSVIDLGCGMPTYLEQIKPATYLGLDLSAEMINRAKKQYPEYEFEVADITDFDQSADVIISILDVFNYLPDFETVKRVIANCYCNLNEGGEFIFDIHSKAVLRTFKDYFDFVDSEDEQFIWESQVVGHKLTHYFQLVDSEYKVAVEKHYQQYYDLDLVVKHMKACGFTEITIINQYNHHIIKGLKESNE